MNEGEYERIAREEPIFAEIEHIIISKGNSETYKAGNTGFRINRYGPSYKEIREWHFTPESSEEPPAEIDTHIRVKYVRMFIYGFYSMLSGIKDGLVKISGKVESTTHRTMSEFLLRVLGEENVYVENIGDEIYLVQIDIPRILTDIDLLKKLDENYNFVENHIFNVTVYEKVKKSTSSNL